MARETAHQLGTPISALLGWVELLRAQSPPGGSPGSSRELEETLDEMERDIERLSKVAQRFSHVGSAPQLQEKDVTPVVKDVVEYLRRRLPGAPGEVEIREAYAVVPPVKLNSQLMTWALENLVNNAVTALDKKAGLIEISVAPHGAGEVDVTVHDNGRGMSANEQRRAFDPGFTTKRRGWGLGLALARRVVEEYHGGRLFIGHSAPRRRDAHGGPPPGGEIIRPGASLQSGVLQARACDHYVVARIVPDGIQPRMHTQEHETRRTFLERRLQPLERHFDIAKARVERRDPPRRDDAVSPGSLELGEHAAGLGTVSHAHFEVREPE
jgi:two-component sensor histidine kinase